MGPYYSTADENAKWLLQQEIHDEKIALTKQKLDRLQKEIESPKPIAKCLPNSGRLWLQKLMNPDERLQAVEEAKLDYQWAVYDKRNARRPLYPRKRAISPSSVLFDRQKQLHNPFQEQSPLFKLLPPELRAEIYRAVFGSLIIEIEAAHAGHIGPPPSADYRIFFGSRITRTTGEEWIKGIHQFSRKDVVKWTPHIVPLLQTCRQIYAEAISILYSESVFKTHNVHSSVEWTRYLLQPRIDSIRTAHLQLSLGYPWSTAPCHQIALQAFARMKNLRKLCILGRSDGMLDCCDGNLIDAELWEEKKDIFLDRFRDLLFIREVDIFLPIRQEILAVAGDERIGHIRVYGLTKEEALGTKDVHCACKHMPEKMRIFRTMP